MVTAVLVGVYLWWRFMLVVTEPLQAVVGTSPLALPLAGLVTAGLFVAGLVAFTRVYSTSRDIDVGSWLPTRAEVGPIALAGSAPVVLVGLTKLVGTLTGVPYSPLTGTYYTAGSPILPILLLVGLSLFLSVPSLVLTCQVLVQGSFGRILGGDGAVVLTTLVTGFVMTSNTGGLGAVPELGKLVGVAVFVLSLLAVLYLTERSDREELRHLVYAPVVLFAAVVVVSAAAEIDSVAEGTFAISHLAVLGIAAFTYERSDSLVVPALAYLSVSLANYAVVLLEAGIRPL